MGLFTHTIMVIPFGNLSNEGQSKIWETEIDIDPLGKGFFVRVWGTKSGPSEAQKKAFSSLLNNANEIKKKSSPETINYLNECNVVPQNIELNSTNLWNYLKPSFIEVSENEAYTAGSGKAGQIAISIGFEIPWEEDHLLQIGTIDGQFHKVYSE
jgi:hypothetical protein